MAVKPVGLKNFLCSDWLTRAQHYDVRAKDSVRFWLESIAVHSMAGTGTQATFISGNILTNVLEYNFNIFVYVLEKRKNEFI